MTTDELLRVQAEATVKAHSEMPREYRAVTFGGVPASLIFARAYLRDNPADDGEPVNNLTDGTVFPPGLWAWDGTRQFVEYDCGPRFGRVRCYTRGHVRRLAAALGVELKETT